MNENYENCKFCGKQKEWKTSEYCLECLGKAIKHKSKGE